MSPVKGAIAKFVAVWPEGLVTGIVNAEVRRVYPDAVW
jgi:hypothetical protein